MKDGSSSPLGQKLFAAFVGAWLGAFAVLLRLIPFAEGPLFFNEPISDTFVLYNHLFSELFSVVWFASTIGMFMSGLLWVHEAGLSKSNNTALEGK